MNTLLTLHAQLRPALTADPQLQLALLVSQLDPGWQAADDEDTLYAACASGDGLAQAWLITRSAFPHVYADLVAARAGGADEPALETIALKGFANAGLMVDTLEGLASGIPLVACGVVLDDLATYQHHPELVALLDWFGITLHIEDTHSLEIDSTVIRAGAALAEALTGQATGLWQDVGWWLGWAFSATGNTLIDDDHESLCEIPPLTWTPDDIAFAAQMIAEAHTVMEAACRARDWLQATPDAVMTLQRLIRQTRRGLQKHNRINDKRPKGQKEKRYVPRLPRTLARPAAPDGAE